MNWRVRSRSWKAVSVTPLGSRYGVLLDAMPLMTPAGARLDVPTQALADAIAEEWSVVDGESQFGQMPFTRMANTAIDQVPSKRSAIIDDLSAYGDCDLICYRAASPPALSVRQSDAWDPWLAWSAGVLSAPLKTTDGITHIPQDVASLAALRRSVSERDDFSLVALEALVSLSGSLVLGLAVAQGAAEPEVAWEASCIEECWQAEQWGSDPEAGAALLRKREAFLRAHCFCIWAKT